MKVRDLDKYIYDEVVIYKEELDALDGWKDLYKGKICNADESILDLEIRTIGGKNVGIVDIRVK